MSISELNSMNTDSVVSHKTEQFRFCSESEVNLQ